MKIILIFAFHPAFTKPENIKTLAESIDGIRISAKEVELQCEFIPHWNNNALPFYLVSQTEINY